MKAMRPLRANPSLSPFVMHPSRAPQKCKSRTGLRLKLQEPRDGPGREPGIVIVDRPISGSNRSLTIWDQGTSGNGMGAGNVSGLLLGNAKMAILCLARTPAADTKYPGKIPCTLGKILFAMNRVCLSPGSQLACLYTYTS
jgi:hypothetical protein